jgi:predicted  nucleic acid-binding Zn-ribbon protein
MNGLLTVSSQPTEKSEKEKQESQLVASLNPDYPNRTARRYLAIEWKRLKPEDQVLLRAKRSLRGIKCIKCGLVGYFAENCPNGCVNHLYDHLLDDEEETEMKEKARKRALKEKQLLLLPSSPTKNKRKEIQQQQKIEETQNEAEDEDNVKQSSVISIPDSFQDVSKVESLESISLFWGNTMSTVSAPSSSNKKKGLMDVKQENTRTSRSNKLAEDDSVVLSTALLKVEKLDISTLRQPSTQRLQELQETDLENIQHSFSFYNSCESNYNRNYSELTLQQVMRRVIRLVQSNLSHQTQELESTFDTTLLVPPIAKVTKHFYPSSLMDDDKNRKELREYYLKKEEENEAKKNASRLAYKSQVSLRPLDELDDFFRGKAGTSKT